MVSTFLQKLHLNVHYKTQADYKIMEIQNDAWRSVSFGKRACTCTNTHKRSITSVLVEKILICFIHYNH